MDGKQPLWPENLLKRHIRPAAERVKIHKHVGFHTFRHSLATLLKANGEDVKTVQELLRHANSRITLDFYTQAVTPAKRAAQDRLVESFVPERMERSAEVNAVEVNAVNVTVVTAT
jgi:integrase